MKKLVFAILMSAAFCIPVAHAANNDRPEPVNLYVKAETWPATMHACAEKAAVMMSGISHVCMRMQICYKIREL